VIWAESLAEVGESDSKVEIVAIDCTAVENPSCTADVVASTYPCPILALIVSVGSAANAVDSSDSVVKTDSVSIVDDRPVAEGRPTVDGTSVL